MILHLPVGSMASMTAAAKELAEAEKRRFPIDPMKFWGRRTILTELQITLPEGWRAQLPKSVAAKSDFGEYESKYTQDGRVLRIARQVRGVEGVQPPERIADLIEWLRAVGQDDTKFIVIEKASK